MPSVQGVSTHEVGESYAATFGTPTPVTSPLYQGRLNSLEINATGANEGVRKTITGSPDRGWMGCPVSLLGTPSSGMGLFRIHSVTSNILAQISVSSGNVLFAFIGGGGTATGPTITPGTFYWIEAIYNVINATHTLLWRVNGADQTAATVAATGSDSVDYSQLFSSSGGTDWYAGGYWAWGSAASDADYLGEPSPAEKQSFYGYRTQRVAR